MSMTYDSAAAERLEAVYLGRDVVAQRANTLSRLNVQPGERVLDIGSGPGFLATELAKATGPTGRVLGIDISEPLIDRARNRADCDWLSYEAADATDIPAETGSFDVVVSTQVAEYVPDAPAFCREFARVLAPGGRGLVMATDWDAVAWHSEDPARMARVLDAFVPHCADPRLPRTLAPMLEDAGLEITDISAFQIITRHPHPDSYCMMAIPFVQGYIRGEGTLPDDVLDAWGAEQEALAKAGRHYFSTARINFEIRKPG